MLAEIPLPSWETDHVHLLSDVVHDRSAWMPDVRDRGVHRIRLGVYGHILFRTTVRRGVK